MNTETKSTFHTVDDEWLASYCGGGLSAAKRFLLDCQAAINPKLGARIDAMDNVGGVLLEAAEGERLSDDFMSGVFERLDTPQMDPAAATVTPKARPEETGIAKWGPKPLIDLFKRSDKPLKWKKMGFGVSRLPLRQDGREKLYLLKSKPGMKMPRHSHHGEEWALILQGGYHVGDAGYTRGDLHREDETCTHTPLIDDHGEACITLVAAEGGLKFTNPFMRLLSPIFRI